MAAIPNVWHLRRVAEASAKPCDVCFKPSTSVLITPDNKDYFYVCVGHLKDRAFATPVIDDAEAAAKKRKEEMDREIEKVKAEYEEKMKKRKQKDKDKKKEEKEEDDKKDKKDKDKAQQDDEEQKAEKEKIDKISAITSRNAVAPFEDIPRIYALQKYSLIKKTFYQKRLDRIRNAEMAKKTSERLRNPSTFPSAPKGNLG